MVSICSLYSWREGSGSSSLATLPLGFNCGFILLHVGHPLGFAPEAALEDLGLPRGPGVEVGLLLGSQGCWQHQVPRRAGGSGSRKYSALARVWRPVLANMLQSSCRENPLPDGSLAGQSTGSQGHYGSEPVHIDFFCLWQLCPSESRA